VLAPQTRLMKGAPLPARQPQAFGDHPPAQGLSTNSQVMLLKQDLSD
jgi:hypothetical protein